MYVQRIHNYQIDCFRLPFFHFYGIFFYKRLLIYFDQVRGKNSLPNFGRKKRFAARKVNFSGFQNEFFYLGIKSQKDAKKARKPNFFFITPLPPDMVYEFFNPLERIYIV